MYIHTRESDNDWLSRAKVLINASYTWLIWWWLLEYVLCGLVYILLEWTVLVDGPCGLQTHPCVLDGCCGYCPLLVQLGIGDTSLCLNAPGWLHLNSAAASMSPHFFLISHVPLPVSNRSAISGIRKRELTQQPEITAPACFLLASCPGKQPFQPPHSHITALWPSLLHSRSEPAAHPLVCFFSHLSISVVTTLGETHACTFDIQASSIWILLPFFIHANR